MDLDQREKRDKLFEISGVRGNYPQFFFELRDGHISFFGNFNKIDELNETSGLPPDLLAQHHGLETWEKVRTLCFRLRPSRSPLHSFRYNLSGSPLICNYPSLKVFGCVVESFD